MATGLQHTFTHSNGRGCSECPGNSFEEWIASVSEPDWVSQGPNVAHGWCSLIEQNEQSQHKISQTKRANHRLWK